MTTAITIAAYALPSFVDLCLASCRSIFGDAPLLVSDDRSRESPRIAAAAKRHGATYCVSKRRRGHLAGDWQGFLNSALWAKGNGCDIALKLSQRFIPLSSGFRSLVEQPFRDPDLWLLHTSKLPPSSVHPMHHATYCQQPLLGDCVAWRPECLDAATLEAAHKRVTQIKGADYAYAEVILNYLTHCVVQGHSLGSVGLADPGEPPSFLRKIQSHRQDYERAAQRLGVKGEFCLKEWREIEPGREYFCVPEGISS